MNIQWNIRGYLVGPIWWPVGAECWKDLDFTCDDESTLRDNVVRAHCFDGDFSSCDIAQGELVGTYRKQVGGKTVTVQRSFPLTMFPSVKDCLHSDPDWWPTYPDECDDD